MTSKYWLFLIITIVLSGCDGLEHINAPPKRLVVQVKSLTYVRDIEQVLIKRFSEYYLLGFAMFTPTYGLVRNIQQTPGAPYNHHDCYGKTC